MESLPFDVSIGIAALEFLERCSDFELQQIALVWGSENAVFLLEYDVVENPLDDCIETNTEYLTSDSDSVPDVD